MDIPIAPWDYTLANFPKESQTRPNNQVLSGHRLEQGLSHGVFQGVAGKPLET